MKKTLRYLSMAALLVLGAIMTGCSNDDNIFNQQQTKNNDNIVTLTATVSLDGGAGTRAITPSTGAKTFESTNQIAVIYKDGSDETQKAVSTDFTPSADGTKATFTVSLANPATNSAIRYIYPATMAKDVSTDATITDNDATIDYTGLLGSQNGDLTTLGTNYDLAVYDGNLNGTDLPASATLTNPLAICAFTLTNGGSDITNTVTGLNISDGTNTYIVKPSALPTIYVAMKPASGNIAFTATTATNTYFKTAAGKTLEAGKLYPISVSMVKLVVGGVICADGNVYESYLDYSQSNATYYSQVVATICYVGNDAETNTTYNHGLALARLNCRWYQGSPNQFNSWCRFEETTCLPTQYDNKNAAKGDVAGIANTDYLIYHAPNGHKHEAANATRTYATNYREVHPTGTSEWFLPTAGQWDKMYNATISIDRDFLQIYANLQDGRYWTSTEYDQGNAWCFIYKNRYADLDNVLKDYVNEDIDRYKYYVRPVLAF